MELHAKESMNSFRIKRAAVILLALFVLPIVSISWLLGSELVRPALHPVPLPIGFTAQHVAIQGQGYAIAGWWIDNYANTPVVLLLPGIRGDLSSAVEQSLIEIYKLGKNGGTLLNRINSIAKSRPDYATQVQRGYQLLQSVG